MKIYFIAKDEESLNNESKRSGFIENNYQDVTIGKKLVQKLNKDIDEVFIVHSPRKDIMSKTDEIINSLSSFRPGIKIYSASDDRVEFNDEYLSGFKGLKPNKTVPKILSSIGVSIFSRIGTTNERINNLMEIISAMLDYNNTDRNIVFVLIADSDVFKFMQNNKQIRKYCAFGDEEIGCFGKISASKIKISNGDVKEIEIAVPKEIGYDGKVETIAETKIRERQMSDEKFKI